MVKIDLHLHSKYSNYSDSYLLRKVGIAPSYSDPEHLYQKLHAEGMTYKTLTDLNSIQGCLEILHHDDVFISEEVSTFFPDGCCIHLLVWNISQDQHRQIQEKRGDLYRLVSYLREQKIAHGVTDAMRSWNQKLTADYVEKMVLLFSTFEVVNAVSEPLSQKIVQSVLQSLTPEKWKLLVERQKMMVDPLMSCQKAFVGGSNDHAALFVAKAYTEAKEATSLSSFFECLERREVQARGVRGNPLELSRGIYQTLSYVAQDRLSGFSSRKAKLIRTVMERLVEGKNPIDFSFRERLQILGEAIRSGQILDLIYPRDGGVARTIAQIVQDPAIFKEIEMVIDREKELDRRLFSVLHVLTQEFCRRLIHGFLRQKERGQIVEAIQCLGGLLPAYGVLAPLLLSYYHHRPSRELLEEVSWAVAGEIAPQLRNEKRAWFTDTLDDVNGVARTIGAMATSAQKLGHSVTVITSRTGTVPEPFFVRNFEPLFEFELLEYPSQKISVPPVLEMIDYIHREGFTELIISTTGPVGFTALMAGKLLGLRMTGIYHTDFPQYARILSGDDPMMESWMWGVMDWFYGKMDLIYCNSDVYRRIWKSRGIPEHRLEIFPRGLDTDLFNVSHRDSNFWRKYGAMAPVLLYVGRVSKEKELVFLTEVAMELQNLGISFHLAVVGDGPYLEEMKRLFPAGIYCGVLRGDPLAKAYASADLFVFPSTTDTFGNVIIEAMAAGLPTLVSNIGGPCELVKRPEQGSVYPARDHRAWREGICFWLDQLPSLEQRKELSQSIHAERNWDAAFEKFWSRGLGD